MVVMSLVGIASTVALVSHSSQLSHRNLKVASRQVISQLRHLRQRAIVQNTTTTAEFYADNDDIADNFYEVWDLGEHELPAHIRFGYHEEVDQTPKGGALSAGSLDGVSFSGNKIAFEANGTASGLGGYIYLTNAPRPLPVSGEEQYEAVAISVNMTGSVRLYKWKAGHWE